MTRYHGWSRACRCVDRGIRPGEATLAKMPYCYCDREESESKTELRIPMKKIDPDDFRVRPGKNVDLDKWPTRVKPVFHSREEYQTLLVEHAGKLSEQQSRLYADNS